MSRPTFALFFLLSAAAHAAEPAKSDAPKAQAETPAPLAAIVRGLYVEARLGGGYMVAEQKIPKNDKYYPELSGKPERLGPGTMMHLALGVDLLDAVALQAVGGSTLVSSTRKTRVRDLGLVFGGAGLRFSLPMSERLRFVVAAAGVYVQSDNGVEKAETGAGAFGNLGLEYFVHVRHFSIGLDASVLAPFSPARVFVGLGPQIKYTF
jgi:hypothetical protein